MMMTPDQLKQRYLQGHNAEALLREERGLHKNSREIIEISYDLRTGTYIEGMKTDEMVKHKQLYTKEIVNVINSLCCPNSVLEAGVGEATTFSGVIKNLGSGVDYYGFDLSWSRVAYASRWLKQQGLNKIRLCSGDLFNIPFSDNSIDVVYTSHSIEPNGGNEKPILQELYRIAKKYLILLEPGYDLVNEEARARMDFYGYCSNIIGCIRSLGYEVMKHELFPFNANPLNPAAITIIRKGSDADLPDDVFACPKYKTPLTEIEGMLYSPEAYVVYPVLADIPCLRIENGILASKYPEIMEIG